MLVQLALISGRRSLAPSWLFISDCCFRFVWLSGGDVTSAAPPPAENLVAHLFKLNSLSLPHPATAGGAHRRWRLLHQHCGVRPAESWRRYGLLFGVQVSHHLGSSYHRACILLTRFIRLIAAVSRVTTKTNIPKFKRTEFSTMRRFSDFLGIHDLLVGKYMRLGRIIPPAPSKNIIGSTKVKISPQQSEPGTPMNQEWVEIRRAALERFVHRTAQHPVLRVDLDFMNFLESDQELPRSVNTSALSGAGVIRLFNKVGETVNKITYKMDENDPWFDDKITEVESLDANLQKLHNAMKSLVTSRRELSLLTGLVAKSAAMLSTCEEHTGLSRALSNLADVEEKIELLRSEQANSDFFILAEFIKDYLGLFGAIKCIFHERVKAFQNWQYAQMQLSKRRENRGRFELANRADKLDQAQQEVDDVSFGSE